MYLTILIDFTMIFGKTRFIDDRRSASTKFALDRKSSHATSRLCASKKRSKESQCLSVTIASSA